jgi:hypothetical protein
MRNQPGPVARRHQQVASTQYEPQTVDLVPAPELFDVVELSRVIWASIHPED